jgi:hypothetical protein
VAAKAWLGAISDERIASCQYDICSGDSLLPVLHVVSLRAALASLRLRAESGADSGADSFSRKLACER